MIVFTIILNSVIALVQIACIVALHKTRLTYLNAAVAGFCISQIVGNLRDLWDDRNQPGNDRVWYFNPWVRHQHMKQFAKDIKGIFSDWRCDDYTIFDGLGHSLWIGNEFRFFRDHAFCQTKFLHGLDRGERKVVWRELQRDLKRRRKEDQGVVGDLKKRFLRPDVNDFLRGLKIKK